MRDDNCIFCKLANGDIPTNAIYEDDEFKVILDASPATRGHALILPKNHFANIYEVDDATASKILPLAKRVAANMVEKLGCDGVNILQNNGEAAGQTVFHLHVHVIPRFKDGKHILDWSHEEFSDDEMKAICKELKMN